MNRYPGRKGGTAVAVRKGIPHNHVVLLEAVYTSPGRPWNNTDILKLSGFKRKAIWQVI
jgi:hypothetical protein